MRLYRTPAGTWTGTQADAKASAKAEGSSWAEVEVPTDKPGLLAFLNANRPEPARRLVEPDPAPKAPEVAPEPLRPVAAPSRADMSASAVLSRMDNPGVDIDAQVERIAKSRGHALKRYAGAVAMAFQGLPG